MGAPVGNTNAAGRTPRLWAAAITRALAQRSRVRQIEALDELAGLLLDKAGEGDLSALKELGDRLDGRPAQTLQHTGEEGGPVQAKVIVEYIAASGGLPVPSTARS